MLLVVGNQTLLVPFIASQCILYNLPHVFTSGVVFLFSVQVLLPTMKQEIQHTIHSCILLTFMAEAHSLLSLNYS